MTTNDLPAACGFLPLVPGEEREIKGVFTGDLLSWAMGRAKEGDAWFTVMGNVNAVAVACLAECACVVLCHGAVLDDTARQRAAETMCWCLPPTCRNLRRALPWQRPWACKNERGKRRCGTTCTCTPAFPPAPTGT